MKEFKFKDLQTGGYSNHTTLEGLFTMLCQGYCECGQGHDKLDEKDDTMKCLNCYRINNLDKISEKEMIDEILANEYCIEYICMTIEDIKQSINNVAETKGVYVTTFVEIKDDDGKKELSIFIDGKNINEQQSLLEDIISICDEGVNSIELYPLETLSKVLGVEIEKIDYMLDDNVIKLITK